MGKRKRIAGVYCILNKINSKRYVGHSRSIYIRWDYHKYRIRRGEHQNIHLQNSWNIHGEENFIFSVLEVLPQGLTMKEYEKVETKWMLEFKSHLSGFGYNNVLPGNIPIKHLNGNRIKGRENNNYFICIDANNKVYNKKNRNDTLTLTGIKENKLWYYYNYWNSLSQNKYRSHKGWIVVREKDYDENFDYINYHHPRKDKLQDSYYERVGKYKHKRKSPKDIIPYRDRNIKRVPIISVNVETGKEIHYKMVKDSYGEFLPSKVYKCLNHPFKRYKHRGHWFKYA